jgi:hypothetical protein
MRFVCDIFSNGKRRIVETTDDGDFIRYLEDDPRESGVRIASYLELGCKDTNDSIDALLRAIEDIKSELVRRRATPRKVTLTRKRKTA